MTREQFRQLNKNGQMFLPRSVFPNELPSDTDPTLNVPVAKVYNAMVNGLPLDVRPNKMAFNNLHADEMTTIERRNTDKFDVVSEARRVQNNVDTSVKKLTKHLKQKDNEK